VTSSKPHVLMMAPLASFPHKSFDEDFTVARLWQQPDPEAFLKAEGGRFRGVVAAGKRRIDADLLAHLPAVEIVASIGVGYDRLDPAALAARGIVGTNTPDVLTEEVADLTLGLLLATVRRLPQAERHLRSGGWQRGGFPVSPSLRGRRIGIFGLGRIGKAVARRLQAFDLAIGYSGRTRQEVPYHFCADLAALAGWADVLILLAPLTEQTRGRVDAAVLDALGEGGVLINVARGALVDREALIDRLRRGRILAAGLDVFWDEPRVPAELLDLDNVVLLPHVGSATLHTRGLMIDLVHANLASWFQGKGALTPIPETPVPAAAAV
jgi:lactate dehydrogenase-like 2-hydroxyacid dehydrogenase